MQSDSGASRKLLKTGVIFSAISFITGLGNLAFQMVMGRNLKGQGDYGDANSAITGFLPLLGLLPQIAIFAVTHYIAHFKSLDDQPRLQGLLLGCRKFIFWITVGGSLFAVVIIKPLSLYFHYSQNLMLVTLICALFGLWGSFATMLTQGLAWFKRLALIGLVGVILRLSFGWLITFKWPSAETAVLATGFALLSNLILLFWRKELVIPGKSVAPWNREFGLYCFLSTAFVVGNFCFFQGDLLIGKKYFGNSPLWDGYTAVGTLARALLQTVAPLLAVLFTSRSGHTRGGVVAEQLKLMGLSGVVLIFGAVCLIILRPLCLHLVNKDTPAAESMVLPYAVTMVFIGLLQGLANWALASRWSRVTLLHGVLGLSFWLTLLTFGQTPATMLNAMPIAAGLALGIFLVFWLITMRRHHPPATAKS
jgi:hypothetical protein